MPAPAVPAAAASAAAAPEPAAPAEAVPAVAAPAASEKPDGEMAAPQKSGEAAPPPEQVGQDGGNCRQTGGDAATIAGTANKPNRQRRSPRRRSAKRLGFRCRRRPRSWRHREPPADAKIRRQRRLGSDAKRDSDGLRLTFSFAAATPAALFRRADTVWLVFDSTKPLDLEPIRSSGGSMIADVSLLPLDKGQAVRIRLNRPQMPSLTGRRSRTAARTGRSPLPIRCRRRPQPLIGDPQHHRSRACQCHRAVVQTRAGCTGSSIPTPATP